MRTWRLPLAEVVFVFLLSWLPVKVWGDPEEASLLWGPYRPSLCFGMRPMLPKSILLGLMWTGTQDEKLAPEALRHECNLDEEVYGPSWNAYDPRIGGTQFIQDAANQVDITTQFIRLPDDNKGDWAVRVKGAPRRDAPKNLESTLVFYASMEHNPKHGKGELQCSTLDDWVTGNTVRCHGHSPGLDEFQLTVQDTTVNLGANADRSALLHSVFATEDQVWNAKCECQSSENNSHDSADRVLKPYFWMQCKAKRIVTMLCVVKRTYTSLCVATKVLSK